MTASIIRMINRRSKTYIIILFTVALTLMSCNRNTIFHHFSHTDVDGWLRADTLHFPVSDIHAPASYSEDVSLRITDAYPYTSLTFIVEQKVFPPKSHYVAPANSSAGVSYTTLRDTLTIDLVHRDGRVVSRGVTYYTYTHPIRSLDVIEGDSLHISIFHCMSCDTLPGVSDVGVSLSLFPSGINSKEYEEEDGESPK